MPEGAVYVGRPTRYGNPYELKAYTFENADGTPAPQDMRATREMAARDFELWLEVTVEGQAVASFARMLLRGKDLACWCPLDEPCHADVLLRVANEVPV